MCQYRRTVSVLTACTGPRAPPQRGRAIPRTCRQPRSRSIVSALQRQSRARRWGRPGFFSAPPRPSLLRSSCAVPSSSACHSCVSVPRLARPGLAHGSALVVDLTLGRPPQSHRSHLSSRSSGGNPARVNRCHGSESSVCGGCVVVVMMYWNDGSRAKHASRFRTKRKIRS